MDPQDNDDVIGICLIGENLVHDLDIRTPKFTKYEENSLTSSFLMPLSCLSLNLESK
jgi:hypothetical protein